MIWIDGGLTQCIVVNIILGVFLVVFIKNGMGIYNELYVKDAVSGNFADFAQY